MPSFQDVLLFSNRMSIAACPERLGKFSEEHSVFYMRYACFVFRTLRRGSFQRFLGWMMKREDIREQIVKDVEVRVLPLRRKNRNGLAGKCNAEKGKIQIYPRTLKSCRKLIQDFGKDGFVSYVESRARAALIHELLHLKYADDESKVRKLTESYFSIFSRHQGRHNAQTASLYGIIFKPSTAVNVRPNRVDAPAVVGSQVSSGNMV